MMDKAILCIDDEKIVLDSLKSQLQNNFADEYLLEFAEDAVEGLEVIDDLVKQGVKVVIIISDWLMPGMKGDEFLIKVNEKYPLIVKIVLTGQAPDDAIERAINEANVYKVVRKPWNAEELVNTIRGGLSLSTYVT